MVAVLEAASNFSKDIPHAAPWVDNHCRRRPSLVEEFMDIVDDGGDKKDFYKEA